jgi:hypothetical protein
MTKQAPATGFSASERDYIRRELDMFFSTLPTVAEGFQLKTWRGGPQAGRPKVPPVARSLIDRGLMRLDTSERLPRLFFTETGLVELRAMIANRRLADPKRFAHVRQELGIDVCHDAVQPVWQGIFRDAVHLENEKGRHFLDGHRHPWLHRKGNDKSESSPDEVESRMGGRVPLDWAWTQMHPACAAKAVMPGVRDHRTGPGPEPGDGWRNHDTVIVLNREQPG